jgi:hypothetical protein
MTGHVLEAREVTGSAFVSSGEPGFVTSGLKIRGKNAGGSWICGGAGGWGG